MTAPSMAICAQCGVIAPIHADKCDSCKAALPPSAERMTISPRADGRYWLQVRAQFKCKHCDKRSPINHVDVDGTFTCLRCQGDQGADAGVWATGLRFCHEVGDLAGPDPQGRHPDPETSIAELNKWADIGVDRTRANLDYDETIIGGGGIKLRSLFLQARPGVPLCDDCRSPLEIEVEEPSKLRASCASCGTSHRYETDPKAHRMVKAFLGALSDDHRADRSAKIAATEPGAPVAIECPSCGAALGLEATDHFVICEFCHTPSKIPSRVRSQLFTEGVELEPFWLMFEGPSKARDKLVKKAIAAENKAAKQRRKEEDRRRSEQEARRRAIELAETRKANQARMTMVLVVGMAILGVILFILARG